MPDDIAAAPVFLKLHDGTLLRMSPLSDEDMSELTQWCQSRIINMVDAAIPASWDKHRRDERISLAIQEAAKISWMSPQGARMLSSIDGIAYMCWLGVRANHPEMTLKQLWIHLKDVRNREHFDTMFRHANNLRDATSKKVERTVLKKMPKK